MVTVKSSKPVRTKTVICTKCGYELEYTGEDVKSHSGYSMGEFDTSYYIVCPRETCGEHTYVHSWSSKD